MVLTKRPQQENVVLVPSRGEKIKATIKEENSSHAIQRLTQLYQDPIKASVRETYSNAYDATMELPESERRPVEIKRPSSEHPFYVVKDLGIGMSSEEVRTKFAHYSSTSKLDNLDAVGSHGLGGKSPLAYTSGFSVVTTKDGETTKFSMDLINGEVETTITSVERTDTPNGTEVTIPVRHSDIDRFNESIDVYASSSWSFPVIIDGELRDTSDLYYRLGPIHIHGEGEDEIYGEIVAVADVFPGLVFHEWQSYVVGYEIGGWIYGPQGESTLSYDFIVRVRPGILDFSSSRDAITANRKFDALVERQEAYFASDRFRRAVLGVLRDAKPEEVARLPLERTKRCVSHNQETDELTLMIGQGEPITIPASYLDNSRTGENYFRTLAVGGPRALCSFTQIHGDRSEPPRSVRFFGEGALTAYRHEGFHDKIYEFFHATAGVTSDLTDVLRELEGGSLKGNATTHYRYVLVGGVDDKILRGLVSKRGVLFETYGPRTYMAFAEDVEELKKAVPSKLKKLAGRSLEIADGGALLKELRSHSGGKSEEQRSEEARIRKERMGRRVKVSVIPAAADPMDVIKGIVKPTGREVPFAEILAGKHRTLFTAGVTGEWQCAYADLVNRNDGAPLKRPLYIFDERLTTEDWHEMKKGNQSNFFLSDRYESHYTLTPTGRAVIAHRRYGTNHLEGSLALLSEEELLSGIFNRYRLSLAGVGRLLRHLGDEDVELRDFLESERRRPRAPWEGIEPLLRPESAEAAVQELERRGSELYLQRKRVHEVIQEVFYNESGYDDMSWSFVERLFKRHYLNARYDVNEKVSDMTKAMIEHTVNRLRALIRP